MSTSLLSTDSLRAIYIVDDRPSDLLFLRRLCERVSKRVEAFDCPNAFLAKPTTTDGVLLADLRMPKLNGIELYRRASAYGMHLTAVIVTGFATATACRAAFLAGVYDFIEKDFESYEFIDILHQAVEHHRTASNHRQQAKQAWQRFQTLTRREREVALLLAQGESLKEVGGKLGISPQTTSKHRGHIFAKLQVRHEVELSRMLDSTAQWRPEVNSQASSSVSIHESDGVDS